VSNPSASARSELDSLRNKGDSTADAMSEWVGIDGFLNGNKNLIQAGIFEQPVSPASFGFYPGWEILPAAAVNACSDIMCSNFANTIPGDTFTVTVTQVTSTTWTIDMDDMTQGETFSTTQTYPLSGTSETSAEWIVEASTLTSGGQPAPLADYTPTTFTNLSVAGSDSDQIELALFQGTDFVSVPSGTAEGGPASTSRTEIRSRIHRGPAGGMSLTAASHGGYRNRPCRAATKRIRANARFTRL